MLAELDDGCWIGQHGREPNEAVGVADGTGHGDTDAEAARGVGFEHLDQLALEHLYGVR